MPHRFGPRVILVLLSLALVAATATPARADELVEVDPEVLLPAGGVTDLEVYGTHPDEGLMIAGAVTFWFAYLIAPAVILPIEAANCGDPDVYGGVYDCDRLGLLFVPFGHLAAGGWASIIGGSVLIFPEIIGLFMFIGGAAHHHPNEPPAPAREGDVDVDVSASGSQLHVQLEVTF